MTVRKKRKSVPLIVEDHPDNYNGYPFITLIQYRQQHFLTIVDNSSKKSINVFVLDYCAPEKIDEEFLITVAAHWYQHSSDKYPLSIEFSKRGLVSETSKLLRTFNIDFVSRVIGPLPSFPMGETTTVRRRKRKVLPKNIHVKKKNITS